MNFEIRRLLARPTPGKESHALFMVKRVRELAVLLRIYNATFNMFTLMMEAWLVVLVVINTSIAVKYFALRGIMAAIFGCALCMALFKPIGEVYDSSRDIYGTISNLVPHSALLRRYRKAYRPLRIDIGNVGYADMMLCLTILSMILQSTVNLVMTM